VGKSCRTTITVPAELKARMNAVDEKVNWSAVASQAFEQKLDEIERYRSFVVTDDYSSVSLVGAAR
jgi:hypothetical protein